MSLSRNRILRRLTSLFAAFALMNAVAAPSAAACEQGHAMTTHVAPVNTAGHHASGVAGECTEPGSRTGEHDADCLARCLSMAGCSTPCFEPQVPQRIELTRDSATPWVLTQSHPTRSLAPDRPPPRV